MPKSKALSAGSARPFLELHIGGLHLIVQRVPSWLIAVITTVGGAGFTWWVQR